MGHVPPGIDVACDHPLARSAQLGRCASSPGGFEVVGIWVASLDTCGFLLAVRRRPHSALALKKADATPFTPESPATRRDARSWHLQGVTTHSYSTVTVRDNTVRPRESRQNAHHARSPHGNER